jgi:hypothetical protein
VLVLVIRAQASYVNVVFEAKIELVDEAYCDVPFRDSAVSSAACAGSANAHAATSVAMKANAKREHRGAPTRSADGASGQSRTENGIYKPKR